MKGIFVILDGVSDEPSRMLGFLTPLASAKTPHLDYFAHRANLSHCFPIARGIAPQSSSGVVSLFGADYRRAARGVLEAMGAGVTLQPGDLALRCNFATIDSLAHPFLVDRRAGRTLTSTEARILAQAINKNVSLPYAFELIPTIGHRAVLIFRGAFSPHFSNVDPHYQDGVTISAIDPSISFATPYDDSPQSKLAADMVNSFVRKSFIILDNHPINIARKKKGFFAANFILCRDPGNTPLSFPPLPDRWMGLGYMPLEIGFVKAFGMALHTFTYPDFKGMDSYAHLRAGFSLAIKNAIAMLKKHAATIDYFYIHFKETDIPGHDNKPLEKVKLIELLDTEFFSFLRQFLTQHPARLVITADHTTSCRAKGHTADPVPVLFYDPAKPMDHNRRFTEAAAQIGKNLSGKTLLRQTILAK